MSIYPLTDIKRPQRDHLGNQTEAEGGLRRRLTSFLALVLQKELADHCRAAGVTVEWGDLLRDLDRLQEATIDKDGKRITTRTAVSGQVGRVFQAAGVALTPNMREYAT